MTRGKEGYYIMKKGQFAKKDIIILNMHTPNNRVLKYIKQNQMELKR